MPYLTHDNLVTLAWLILLMPLLAMLLALLSWVRREGTGSGLGLTGWSTRILSLVSLICSVLLAMGPADEFPLTFRFLVVRLYVDALSVYFVLLVNLVAFFASWYTVNFLRYDDYFHAGAHNAEPFHALFNAFHLTMLIVPMVDNLVVLWMAIELTTLASTLLVRYRRRRSTLEAAWKYIIITTAGIVFALFGTLLLTVAIDEEKSLEIARLVRHAPAAVASQNTNFLGATGETPDFMAWSVLARRQVAQKLDPELVLLSFAFILVGYGTKAGLAPLHTWLPDGHGEAPSPVSALLSGVLLKSALYAILRFYTITCLNDPDSKTFASVLLLGFGLLSLGLAIPFILKHNKFKRILAYHSLEHMGIIVFGLGIGTRAALFGALLHALNHALTKAFMFLTFSNIRHEYACYLGVADPEETEIRGVLKSMPFSGLLLLYGGLGLVGSPPFNIFLSEFIILWAALQLVTRPQAGPAGFPGGIYALTVALFLVSVSLIFGGLVLHLSRLLLGQPPQGPTAGGLGHRIADRPAEVLMLVALAVVIVIFGIWIPTRPIGFPDLLGASVQILQEGARP